MRFLSLDLIRYGHFTDRAVTFRPDAGLHVVYGANEAGKSSALSAFSDLLFGFPDRDVRFDFLHEARDLRIGAEIAARSGARLAFRRRKGRKNTLLEGAAETALNDDALSAFLGGLERPVFERAFGLDSERLRAGADEMLADGGEIGQMLFSAASGLTGLRSASEALAADADTIYAPRRSQNRSFYQALDRHDEARKAERALELNAGDWKALLKEEREIEEDLAAVQDRRRARAARIVELERLQRLRGLLKEIDRHAASLADFADITGVSDAVGAELERLEAKRVALDASTTEKAGRLAALERDLEGLSVDDALLARRGDVSRLATEGGLYAHARETLPRLRQELQTTEDELASLAGELGFATIADLEAGIPTAIVRAELEALVQEGAALARDRAAAAKALAESRQALADLEGQGGEGALTDPTPLRRRYDALRPDIAGLAAAETLETELQAAERALADMAAVLRPPVADVFALSRQSLPTEGELREHREKVNAATAACAEIDQRLAGYAEEEKRIGAQLDRDREQGPVPTRSAILEARERREALFSAFVAGSDDADVYAGAVRLADDLADDALNDAERVARHAENLKRLDETRGLIREAGESREASASAADAARADYRALFAGIDPLSPDEMIDWLRRVEALLGERETVLKLRDRKAALERKRAELDPALAALARDLGAEANLPDGALARHIEAALERLGERWASAREREGQLSAARQAIARREAELETLKGRQQDFDERFGKCLQAFGLSRDTGLAAADTALRLWARVPALAGARARLSREAEADKARIAAFEAEANALATALAPDLSGEAPAAIIRRLSEQVETHAGRAARRETLGETAASLRRELEGLAVESEGTAAERSELEANLPAGVASEGLAARLRQRSAFRHELAEARRRFDEGSEGAAEAETRALADGLDAIACRQELEALAADDAEDEAHLEDLRERRLACRNRRQALEHGESAETAAFDRVSAETEARALARDWVVLRLAGKLLDGALERYRQGRADPILAAAGGHFRTLTRGAFEGLTQAYGEQDALVLSSVRAGGAEVPVGGLSDGTRDQLYLALRLAFLEDYAGRNEPAPLIVDDIFQTFDDDRSAAGLKALAGLSGIQTILFTHEASVVDIARRELGEAADIITLER